MTHPADAASSLPIPHRPPFLFLTRIDERGADAGLYSYEFPRQGDSFSLRMFPELLTVEAMTQAAVAFHGSVNEGCGGRYPLLASLDRVRFSGQARPGDRLTIKIRYKEVSAELVTLDGEVWVHHRMISQAEIVLLSAMPVPS